MKIQSLLLAVMLSMAASAFAGHCPMDMKEIDAALAKNPSLSTEQLATVKKLRAQGEAQHLAGKHGDSVGTLYEAMKILGLRQ